MNLTLFSLLYLISLSFSVYIGYWVARKKYHLKNKPWKASGIESSIIGLFGLILSFTLLIAGNASRDRLVLIHQHVDELSSLYRNASFASPPVRDTAQVFVRRILAEKVFESKINAFEEDSLNTRSNNLYKEFWQTLVRMARENPALKSDIETVMQELNKAAALHYRLEYGVEERTSWIMITMIAFCSLLIGVIVGFANAFNESDHYLVPVVFTIMTWVTVMVIQDINDPQRGFFRPSLDNYTNAYTEFSWDEN